MRKNYHLVTLVVILSAVLAWDYKSLHPALELDLAGQWEASACSQDGEVCDAWTGVSVPGHFAPAFNRGRSWQRVRFKKSFVTPKACKEQTCKLVFAEVGDTLDASLNGVELRRVHERNVQNYYEKNFGIGVDLPASILRGQEGVNHLVLDVKSLKRDQTGIRTAPVAIVKQLDGQRFVHGKTFRSLYLPLVGAVIICLCMLLLEATSGDHLSLRQQVSLRVYAVVSALFMVSFSELPRSLIPIEISVPLHFFLRIAADGGLLLLLCYTGVPPRFRSLVQKVYVGSLAAFVGLLFCGFAVVFAFLDFDVASVTYDAVRILNPLCASAYLALAVWACLQRRWAQALSLSFAWTVIMHDYLVGSGYLQAEFMSKYHHACVVLGYSLVVAGQAGRRREAELVQLAAERKVSELARQVAHDVRSPLEALRVVLRLHEGMPGDLRVLMTDSAQRIDDIIDTMRVDAANLRFYSDDHKGVELHSMMSAGLQETKLRNLQRKICWQEDFSSIRGCFVDVDAGEFRRVFSNLLNNATEALDDDVEGRVSVAAASSDAGYLRIVIADSGPGIPDSVLSSLGERGITIGKKNGSGLGLSHAWHSMKSWNGDLTCRKPVHGGTEIILDLPRAARSA